ncbi:Aste57867_3787 [Aphanomyces stellatus]|uniref:Aste57867_3787 protein n=1 Tax=Aphanomyces stellatus TaxID=120398 RepID=A0A485KES8_9STRA|nr:hypothetical protein As57867_003776 [Aphanomyces stellatus]VFT80937.1 Aste57867_3787 [Aphanomyces stellatus]
MGNSSVAPLDVLPSSPKPASLTQRILGQRPRQASQASSRNSALSSLRRISNAHVTDIRRATVLPGLTMFICTLSLVFLSIVLLAILISQGMFERLVVNANAQIGSYFWAPYGQSCHLTSDGFVPNSCDADTASVIPATPFASVGTTLASQWAAELTQGRSLTLTSKTTLMTWQPVGLCL